MKKTNNKMFAIIIVAVMLLSNLVSLATNISLAIQENVTVEFSTDNDGKTTLSNDGKTLIYTCSDNSSYRFQLVQNGEPIEFTKYPDPTNGDKYRTGVISSNENLRIYSPDINLGMVQIFYSGGSISMVPVNENVDANYYSQYLSDSEAFGENVNEYSFRLQAVAQGGNQQPQNLSNRDFTVDFGTASWVIGDEPATTVTAAIENTVINNGTVNITGSTPIALTNFNAETMQVNITVEAQEGPDFSTRLAVTNGVTRIMDLFDPQVNLPDGTIHFSVGELQPQQQEPGDPISMEETVYTVDFRPCSWEIRNKTATVTVEGENITAGEVEIRGDKVIKINNFDSKLMEAVVRVVEEGREKDEWFSAKLDVNGDGETCIANARTDGNLPNDKPLVFEVQRRTTDGPENNLPPANTSAKVVVTGGNESTIPYTNARISINGFGIWLDDPEQNLNANNNQVPENVTINKFDYAYNAEENNGKVTIRFSSIFINKYVGQIKVIGKNLNANEELETSYTTTVNVADKIDYSNRTDWLNHYKYQEVGFDVEVDKADEYDIEVNLSEMEGHYIAIGNFLWSDEEQDVGKDGYIGNATLELQKVVYEIDLNGDDDYEDENEVVTVLVDEDGNFEDPNNYIEYAPYGSTGSLVVPEGADCTMKITPDYGYQVLTFGSNDNPIVAGEVSEFTFPAFKGNFHLGAQVIAVDDVVDAQSAKVQSGTIELGDKEIDSGSVVLTVSDAEPEEGKIAKFEERAGDYTINSYLDIDLDQVIYKGTEDDVWSERIHELNNEATITLKLEEGVDGNNIIIIHNVNDGDEYEIIEIESYDPATNTITFKTKSFSGYAIAVKPNEEEAKTEQEKYTIQAGDFMVIFSDDEGHEFKLTVMELWNLTDEELNVLGLTKEEYEQAKKELIEQLEDYGTILNVYGITIENEDEYEHKGEVTFKIKMTEEMKKYNTFKLVCIDGDTIGKNDVVDLKIEGDYLVGNLYHLSNYALVAKNVENADTASANPKTEDNIITFIAIFVIATLGMGITLKQRKK
ncbi:MAG: hypothetical protein J5507_02990 [Clostridia bacterium]|nr:hypothetical protein [Clostridia bacterium]